MYFVSSEFKNDFEYLYSFTLTFILGIRLLSITKGITGLYIGSSVYLFLLIILYCLVDRRKIFVTLMIVVHLLSACIHLQSNFLFVLMIIVLFLPLTISINENRMKFSFFSFFIPISFISFCQIYGFKNIFGILLTIDEHFKETFMFDFLGFIQYIVQGKWLNEFNIISKILFNLSKINLNSFN